MTKQQIAFLAEVSTWTTKERLAYFQWLAMNPRAAPWRMDLLRPLLPNMFG